MTHKKAIVRYLTIFSRLAGRRLYELSLGDGLFSGQSEQAVDAFPVHRALLWARAQLVYMIIVCHMEQEVHLTFSISAALNTLSPASLTLG